MDSTQVSGVYNCTYRLLNGFKDLNDVALEIHIIIQPQEKEYFTKLFPSFTVLLLPKRLSMVIKKIPHLKGYIYSSFIDKYIVKKNIDILKNKSSEKYLIDDIDFFIEHMLNIVIDCATTSSNILYKLNLDTKERV